MATQSTDLRTRFYPQSRYGGFTDEDQGIIFYLRVNALLRPEHRVLDVGCGRGKAAEDTVDVRRELSSLRGRCARVIGIDVDPDAADNPTIDEFHLLDPAKPWPLPDASVDMVVSNFVLEHVADPSLFFSELRRVLRPGGKLCMRTTNVFSYFGVLARAVPGRYHAKVVRTAYARDAREERDVFPTVYRCNTVWKLRRMLSRHGFSHYVYGYQAEPAHFGFSRLLYRFGVAHQRHAPHFVKPTLFVFAERAAEAG
ncbi:class I SAM-dependent methyltransferase [Longimicrobium sp.]|uniref:class I SAM-dependent methyltransferase n=1 Tax=Longimicrobium sp. TaxID=2029185 RepID=UPI002EDA8473